MFIGYIPNVYWQKNNFVNISSFTHKYSHYIWLVVYLPLWKICSSVRIMTFPTEWKVIQNSMVPNHQPDYGYKCSTYGDVLKKGRKTPGWRLSQYMVGCIIIPKKRPPLSDRLQSHPFAASVHRGNSRSSAPGRRRRATVLPTLRWSLWSQRANFGPFISGGTHDSFHQQNGGLTEKSGGFTH